MLKFWHIQPCYIHHDGLFLTGDYGSLKVVSTGFYDETTTIKAYNRLMHNFKEYNYVHSNIYSPEHDELIVFCKKSCSHEIVHGVRELVDNPYYSHQLKTPCYIEQITKERSSLPDYLIHQPNCWWCFDTGFYGDWIALLRSLQPEFQRAINLEYNNYWLTFPEEDREAEYKWSLSEDLPLFGA